jgi:hypothetical protein
MDIDKIVGQALADKSAPTGLLDYFVDDHHQSDRTKERKIFVC